MNKQQLAIMHSGKGFIAALDQSGGSTPKALAAYGVRPEDYSSEEQMFDLVHQMRTRIIKNPAFTSDHILGAILFERTMESKIDGKYTADFLWENKGIVPFLKIDKGLAAEQNGVQLMKPMPALDSLLKQAVARNIFGTKMRSVIKEANEKGIRDVIDQQFEYAVRIASYGLVPIIEPEVDIHCPEKAAAEKYMLSEIVSHMKKIDSAVRVIFKVTIPDEPDFYALLMNDPRVVRVVALSGGYPRDTADEKLSGNHGLIASFSRALSEGLSVNQSETEFTTVLRKSIEAIYAASVT
ncbi:MAG: fructose bisphosphate aldolase [Treponema sp.]|jgi:fructose-bisphosphate aldolase class I|nr:fructose bisphosphate aldolase [Treponema sp.]